MAPARAGGGRRTIELERFYDAPVERVWALWTTKQGIESWWGPDGFSTEVTAIDIRPGGLIAYTMSATAAETREYMERAGMPLATDHVLTVREVVEFRRLATRGVIDFIPGVKPYEVGTTVDLEANGGGTRLVVTLDAMHDQHWTEMAVRGWESQLERLAQVLSTGN